MAYYRDLREFISVLESNGLLVTIKREINKDSELMPLVRWQFRGLPEKDRKDLKLHDYTENVEKAVITEALNQHRWNKSRTASALMISRKTLQRKMKRLGLM